MTAGPGPFGRSVVVDAGQAAPPAWDGCERVVVGEADIEECSMLAQAQYAGQREHLLALLENAVIQYNREESPRPHSLAREGRKK